MTGRDEARQQGADDIHTLQMRWNPGRCQAPSTEIAIYGVWTRAHVAPSEELTIEGRDAIGQALQEIADAPGHESSARWVITGHLLDEPRLSDLNVPWPVFAIDAISSTDAPIDAPQTARWTLASQPCALLSQ